MPAIVKSRSQTICVINGEPALLTGLEAETTGEEARSLSSVKPDTRWQYTDGKGHYHAYDEKGETPTLLVEFETYWCADCHDDHESYTRHCRLCGEKIEPRTIDSGPTSTWIQGPTEWTLRIAGHIPSDREAMSVHIIDSEHEWFGVAYLTSQTFSSDEGMQSVLSGHLHKRK